MHNASTNKTGYRPFSVQSTKPPWRQSAVVERGIDITQKKSRPEAAFFKYLEASEGVKNEACEAFKIRSLSL